MDGQMLTPQPASQKQGIGGWLIFIGFRLIAGLIVNIVTCAGMVANKAAGMYYFYGTDIMIGVGTALCVVTIVFYFIRKRPFIYLYIVLAALTVVSNFLAGNGAVSAVQMVIEALLISYLLMSRRVAGVYNFHIKSNAVPHGAGEPMPARVGGLNPQQEKIFADLKEIKKQYGEGSLSEEEFSERKRKLLMGL